jgi:glycosyltransferase involved in cell wall biosynthesis
MNLVSVIVPCNNRTYLLRECLESVLKQTYRNIELIVIDDASDEDIGTVVEEISHLYSRAIKYIRSPHNVGPGAARELGRQIATGEYISYLDSDDIWHEEKIETQVEMLQNRPDVGMSYCISTEFFTHATLAGGAIRKRSNEEFTEFLPHVLFARPWDTGACLWTRSSTELIGPWLPTWTYEDVEYETRAGCYDVRIAFVPRVLCFTRVTDDLVRLSNLAMPRKQINATISYLHVANNLQKHNKLTHTVRQRLGRRLFRNALAVQALGEFTLARESFLAAGQIAGLNARSGLIAYLSSLNLSVLPAHISLKFNHLLDQLL